jgi:hypothetical protein
MTKHAGDDIGVPTKAVRVTSFVLPPPHTPNHDEWLLDEALVETFPASDPIAVSPNSPDPDDRR